MFIIYQNHSATWNTTQPALTQCFIDTALIWMPSLFLLLCFPWTLYSYITSHRITIRWNCYNIFKLIIVIVLAMISATHAIFVIIRHSDDNVTISDHPTIGELSGVVISFLTYCLLVVFLYCQRLFGFVNSGAVWFYLLLKISCITLSIPTFLNNQEHYDNTEQLFVYVESCVIVLLFFVCSFADRVPNLKELLTSNNLYGQDTIGFRFDHKTIDNSLLLENNKKNICPKEIASFPSKLTFWWFNSIAILGFRRPLVADDLWQIRRPDNATNLFKQFNRFWKHKSFTNNNQCQNNSNSSSKKNGAHVDFSLKNRKSGNQKTTYLLSDYNLIENRDDSGI